VDGLILRINYDFLINLKKLGLDVTYLKIKELSRNSSLSSRVFKAYPNSDKFVDEYREEIFSRRFLCSAGNFPVIENIQLVNKNLKFDNTYYWYNITDSRFYVKKVSYDNQRKDIYEAQLARYMDLMYKLFDTYTKNIKTSIRVRLDAYVDPCYVDAGYVSPNSDPKNKLSN
jgi:hypothetical protein